MHVADGGEEDVEGAGVVASAGEAAEFVEEGVGVGRLELGGRGDADAAQVGGGGGADVGEGFEGGGGGAGHCEEDAYLYPQLRFVVAGDYSTFDTVPD